MEKKKFEEQRREKKPTKNIILKMKKLEKGVWSLLRYYSERS